MKENKERLNLAAMQKEKIRQRYKGINTDELDVIPALPQKNFYEDQQEMRVAVYARVSTDDPRQTSSYELQKNHYQDMVNRHPGWKLIDIYADEGMSGTSLQHRDAFIRMITDCRAGKIDLIITKSVSRFARNVLDCIGHVRQLKSMQPPIGVFFETENIYTLNEHSEMSLSFISTLAQEESHNKSEIMNASIEMRFRRGIFLTPPLLGYDQDENGKLIINAEEAKTVRLIFFMYLYGYTCQEIANTLTETGHKTKLGNTTWSPSSVLNVLTNERHCGAVLARKTWTPNYLDHKSKKNRQNRNQYFCSTDHPAIISRDDFIAVQRLISNAKYGNKGILPELHVITEGVLKGYVSINPRWAGFTAKDYKRASESIYHDPVQKKSTEISVNSGDLDLRGYEIARAQFFDTRNKISVTLSSDSIRFSTECVRKVHSQYIEMLVHPGKRFIAIRPTEKSNRNSVQCSKAHNGIIIPRLIRGAAFLPNLFELFKWDTECRYRIIGIRCQNDNESLIMFNLDDTEMLIPNHAIVPADTKTDLPNPTFDDDIKPIGIRGSIFAYPEEWVHNFGSNYYRQAQIIELMTYNETGKWNSQSKGTPFNPEEVPLHITNAKEIEKTLKSVIAKKQLEEKNE